MNVGSGVWVGLGNGVSVGEVVLVSVGLGTLVGIGVKSMVGVTSGTTTIGVSVRWAAISFLTLASTVASIADLASCVPWTRASTVDSISGVGGTSTGTAVEQPRAATSTAMPVSTARTLDSFICHTVVVRFPKALMDSDLAIR